MRFASMRALDISNGENVGVSLFVQGCPFNPHCYNCFNPDTWDFNGGKEWTEETKNKFLELIDRPYIKRISLLGGECLAEQNLDGVLDLIKEIREKYPISQNVDLENPYKSSVLEPQNDNEFRLSYPEKTIWLYTGYRVGIAQTKLTLPNKEVIYKPTFITDNDNSILSLVRSEILNSVDVVVDGEYIDKQRDVTLKWRGSKNQRVIDTKQSLAQGQIVLYCD